MESQFLNTDQTQLNEFMTRIHDVRRKEHDDFECWKWLKARNFDTDKAETMYRQSMLYRKKMGVDTLLHDYTPPESLRKYLPGGFCGFDKEGSPVLIELYGQTDMKGIMHSTRKTDIEKTKLLLGEQVVEMLKEQTKKLGRRVSGITVIIDMTNVGTWMLWGPGIQMYAHMGRVLQDNYPEIVKRTFIVNAPMILPMLWRMFRSLVTDEMKEKVCILGGSFSTELLEHIDASQLPAFLGGTLRDAQGDPRCSQMICQGGKVPESFFLTDLVVTDSMKKINVPPGSKNYVPVIVKQPGSVIRWQFKTDGHDIGFGVMLKGKELQPVERVNSHIAPEDGTFTCSSTGQYQIVFDNSYSWTRSKNVMYSVDVVSPDDQETVADLDHMIRGGSWVALSSESTRL